MVVQGKATTLPVTMDEMVYHTAMVTRACSRTMVVGDMPFMSYQGSLYQAVENGGHLIKDARDVQDAGAFAVVLEAIPHCGLRHRLSRGDKA